VGPGIEENHLSNTANSCTREANMGIFCGLKPDMTVPIKSFEMLMACCTKPDIEGTRPDAKTYMLKFKRTEISHETLKATKINIAIQLGTKCPII
jgi:hypothetical protein